MKKSNLKYYIGIAIIFVIDSLHYVMFNNNDKYDVYWLYDHERYLTNILFDISNYVTASVLIYFLMGYNKRVFKPLFFISLLAIVMYFINYNQMGSLILIPTYLLLAIFLRND